jgi:O-antigen/teichoic acid export membrane protein
MARVLHRRRLLGAHADDGQDAIRLTALGLVLRGAQSVVGLVSVVVVAHALGPDGRGEYFLFVAGLAVLVRLLDLGLSPSAAVFGSRHPGAVGSMHRRLLACLLVIWPVTLGLGVLGQSLGGYLPVELARDRIWLALGMLPLAMYEQIWVHLMVGIRRVVAMNLVQVAAGGAMLALNVDLLVFAHGDVSTAVGIYCAVLALKTPLMIWLASRFGSRLGPPEAAPSARELIFFSLRSYPNALAGLLWLRLPAFVLDITHGSASVGIFSVGQQAVEQLVLPVQAAQDAIYREVSRLPRVHATQAMNRYLRFGLLLMIPVVVVAGAVAPVAVPVLFGTAFDGSAQVIQILLIGVVASVMPALLSPYFFGQLQRPGLASTLAWARVLLASGLSVLVAPAFAEQGVAVALAAAEVCSMLLVLSVYARLSGARMDRPATGAVTMPALDRRTGTKAP